MPYLPFSFVRAAIMKVLTTAETSQVDSIPEGFNNSIRWNAGHALVIADKILHHSDHYEHVLPAHYKTYFNMGTSPADWTDSPPTVEEITEISTQQVAAAKKLHADYRDAPLTNVFDLRGTKFTTVTELLGFLSYHEGMHFGTTKLLLKKTT